jgi:hypothetical protein
LREFGHNLPEETRFVLILGGVQAAPLVQRLRSSWMLRQVVWEGFHPSPSDLTAIIQQFGLSFAESLEQYRANEYLS